MTLPFGWCGDGLHEACKASYKMMWPPVFDGKKGKDVTQENREFFCSCECHGEKKSNTLATPKQENEKAIPRKKPLKKKLK
jgi:hypothetical protein